MEDLTRLQTWLNEECEARNLTWREASIGAGVNPGAISAIMTGARPGLQVCMALAEFFQVRPEYVLRLAGLLPEPVEPSDLPEPVHYRMERLQAFIAGLPEGVATAFLNGVLQLAAACDLAGDGADDGSGTGQLEQKLSAP